MNATHVSEWYGWKRTYNRLELRFGRRPEPVLLKLLEQASEAHWKTDARLLSALAFSAVPQNFNEWMGFLQHWPIEDAECLFGILQELGFLFHSLVPEKKPSTLCFQLSAVLESSARLRPELMTFETMAAQNQWLDVFRAGELMACGHYVESLETFSEREKLWSGAPLALQLRRSIIFGICHQALGNYIEAHAELNFQEGLAQSLEEPFLVAATLRRRLSFCIETEDFQRAEQLEMRLRVQVGRLASEFLSTLFLQERIKLSLALQNTREQALQELQKEQESFIEHGLIHSLLVIPIEERCEIALRSQKPNEALKWIREQAGMSREKGMVNGQLVSGILLLKCQMMLGLAKAASVTLSELEYICREYRFGRDSLKAKALGLLWELRYGMQKKAKDRFEECEALAHRLALPQHRAALQFLGLLIYPSQSRLQKALGPGLYNQTAFVSGLRLALHWVSLQGDHDSKAVQWMSGMLRRLEHGAASCCFFEEWGVLCSVALLTKQGETLENEIQILWLHCRPGGNHFLLLKLFCSSNRDLALSWESIHSVLYPMVPYREFRHKVRVQSILQSFRSLLRKSLVLVLNQHPEIPADFGLSQAARFQFALPCEMVQLKDLASHLEFVLLKSSNAKLTSQDSMLMRSLKRGAGPPKQRNNRPVLAETIAARHDKILHWLSSRGPTSGSKMALGMGFQRKTLHVYLKAMVREGVIRSTGKGRNAVYLIQADQG